MKKCLLLRKKRIKDCFVEVSDEWYPNINGKFIDFKFYPKQKRKGEIFSAFISAWGDDDFYMFKDDATLEEYNQLKKLILSQKILKAHGFIEGL